MNRKMLTGSVLIQTFLEITFQNYFSTFNSGDHLEILWSFKPGVGNLFRTADRFQPGIVSRTDPQ